MSTTEKQLENLNNFLDDYNIMSGRLGDDNILIVPSCEVYDIVSKLVSIANDSDKPYYYFINNVFVSFFKGIDDVYFDDSVIYTSCCEEYVHHNDYGTQPYFITNSCEVICFECVDDDESLQEVYIEYLENNHNHCNVHLTKEHLRVHNYVLLENFNFANGMHIDSSYIDKQYIEDLLKGFTFIYHLNTCHMFETNYTIAVKHKDLRKIIKILLNDKKTKTLHRNYK